MRTPSSKTRKAAGKPAKPSARNLEEAAEAFINRREPGKARKTVMIRVPVDILARIDQAALRRGLSRTGFITSSLTQTLEQMENAPAHDRQR